MSDLTRIKLTKEQVALLAPLYERLKAENKGTLFDCGMLVAQVFLYSDGIGGMFVKYVDTATCGKFQALMGTKDGSILPQGANSAFHEYFAAQEGGE